jgi:hypothetical protein
MGKEIWVAVGMVFSLLGMFMSVILGYAASVGQVDVGARFAPTVASFLLGHWNLAMVAGPLLCCVVVYLGSFMIATGIQPTAVVTAKIDKSTRPQGV